MIKFASGGKRSNLMDGLPPAIRLTGIGFYIAICIGGGVFGGAQLDEALDTGRLFAVLGLFAGLILGVGGAFLLLIDVLKAGNQKGKR